MDGSKGLRGVHRLPRKLQIHAIGGQDGGGVAQPGARSAWRRAPKRSPISWRAMTEAEARFENSSSWCSLMAFSIRLRGQ